MLVLETPHWSLVDAVRQKHLYLPPIIFRYELPTYTFLKLADCTIYSIHGTQDEKISSNSSDRLSKLCEDGQFNVARHSIMSGKPNLRDHTTFDKFAKEILESHK